MPSPKRPRCLFLHQRHQGQHLRQGRELLCPRSRQREAEGAGGRQGSSRSPRAPRQPGFTGKAAPCVLQGSEFWSLITL